MADHEGESSRDDAQEPSLELPSLFRRKKRPEPRTAAPAETPVAEPDTRVVEPVETTPAEPEPQVVEQDTRVVEPVETTPIEPSPPAPAKPRRRAPRRAPRSGPQLPVLLATALVGLVVGLGGALLTYGGLQGCELVRGTESCGGPGLLLLVAIVAVMVLTGGLLLAWLGVSDPRSTSFLGVGITCVVAMVALMETLFSAWMFVAVPVVAAASFLLAGWVTTRLVEQLDDGPGVDVR